METILHYYITYCKYVHRAKQIQSLSQKVLGEGHTIHLFPIGHWVSLCLTPEQVKDSVQDRKLYLLLKKQTLAFK